MNIILRMVPYSKYSLGKFDLHLKDLEGRDGRKCVLTCVDLWYPYHLLYGQKNI